MGQGQWVLCEKRGGKKVSLQVCLSVCQDMEDCDELEEIPESEKEIARSALKKDSGSVVEVVDDGKRPAATIMDEGRNREEAGGLIAKIISIKSDIESKFWEMGETLSTIFRKQYYVDAGYRDWRTFCNDVLDIKWRTATYLKDIYEKFSILKVDDALRSGIGWAKLKELLPIVNTQNVKYWINVAKDKKTSVQVLNAMVKYALGKISKEESEKVPQVVAFRLYEEQLVNVDRALEIARQITKSDSRSYQLEMICVEFRSTYEVDTEIEKLRFVAGLLKKIEAIMKVRFVGDIIDEGTGEVILEAKGGAAG